jgi:GH25 family lysozyme M1 (1,4-beta-N-acetylmuramidase)
MAVRGVDVSDANGSIDWVKVRAAGVRFAICKATEGDWNDPTFSAARIKAIRDAKLIPGAYVYLRPRAGRRGSQEFQMFWKRCVEAGLYSKSDGTIDVRPVIDIEESAFDCSTIIGRFRTRQYIKQAIRECLKVTGGLHPIIYAGKFWREDLGDWSDNSNCQLWYPEYDVSKPIHLPSAWKAATIWQDSETGSVDGINGPVDTNWYLQGDWASFKRKCCI